MTNETVVITGASGGVGRTLARLYGERGANVVLLARGEAGLAGAASDVAACGGQPLALPTDVADAASVDEAALRAEDAFGPIDLWINNAMVTVLGRTWDISSDEFARVMTVNFLGYVHGTLAALRRMRPRNSGTLVQVGSALAYRGLPAQAPYCASKHAIEGFTESLYAELLAEHSGVKLCAVHLPGLNTTQFTWGRNKLSNKPQPVPPIYQPEVAAQAIAWAADRRRRKTYVAPSTTLTIWGNRLAQPLVGRYLAATNIDAQQTDEPAPPDMQDNLLAPRDAESDRGAHGPFGRRAKTHSLSQSLSRHRGKATAALSTALLAAWVSGRAPSRG